MILSRIQEVGNRARESGDTRWCIGRCKATHIMGATMSTTDPRPLKTMRSLRKVVLDCHRRIRFRGLSLLQPKRLLLVSLDLCCSRPLVTMRIQETGRTHDLRQDEVAALGAVKVRHDTTRIVVVC